MAQPTRNKVLRLLRKPVVASLLRQPVLCRIMLASAVVLVAGSWLSVDLWRCPAIELFHLPCPGCGLTRSVKLMLQGAFTESIRYHALGALALLAGVVLLMSACFPRHMRIPLARFFAIYERRFWLNGVLLTLLISYWLFRLMAAWGSFISLEHLTH